MGDIDALSILRGHLAEAAGPEKWPYAQPRWRSSFRATSGHPAAQPSPWVACKHTRHQAAKAKAKAKAVRSEKRMKQIFLSQCSPRVKDHTLAKMTDGLSLTPLISAPDGLQ